MLNLNTTAVVFPGQGSQFVGMGRNLAEAFPSAQQTFAEANACLGFDLSAVCWEGPAADLNDTINAQPALLVSSIAAWRAWREQAGAVIPLYMAGHSLGEITALVAASALSFADGVRLVRKRGELMKAAGHLAPGGMAAVLDAQESVLAEVCAEACRITSGAVQIANYNCPGQLVISGDLAALNKAMELAKAAGIKRMAKLHVSIAGHSPLMQSAQAELAQFIAGLDWATPQVPVIGNVTTALLTSPDEIRAELVAQLVSPVRWTDSIRYMLGQGVTTFVEVGPGEVLTRMLRWFEAQPAGIAVGTASAIAQLLATD